jgi:dGTPase
VSRGGQARIGGETVDGPGYFYRPTVLADVPVDARLSREEIFGPVAPITVVDDDDQAVAAANDTEFGLVSYVYTENIDRALRVVERLEALNLTSAVRDGILRHSSGSGEPATLEGKIVRLVDRIAYINHDIDDAVRAGVLLPDDLPAEEIAVLGATGSARIDTLVHDLVEHSERAEDIVQGPEVGGAMQRLRTFMFERVYLGPAARAEHARIERVVRGLFDWYCTHPTELPERDGALDDRVIDYLAGMTDRYAIRAWTDRFVPRGLGL